jgi:hypothetical protein
MNLCPLCQQSTEDAYNDHQWCPSIVDAEPVPFRDGSGEMVWFVSVFGLIRSYGGPEEGGWWFDEGPRVAVFVATTLDEAEDIAGSLDSYGYVDEENDRTLYRITRGLPEGPWFSTYAPWE